MGDHTTSESSRRPPPPPVPPPVPRGVSPPANPPSPPPLPAAEPAESPVIVVTRGSRRTGTSSDGGTGLVVTLLLVAAAGTLAYVSWPKLVPHVAPVGGTNPPPASKPAVPDPPAAARPGGVPDAARADVSDSRPDAPRPSPLDVGPRRPESPPAADARAAEPPAVPAPVVATPPVERSAAPASAPERDRAAVEAALGAAARALREADWAEARARLAAAESAVGDDAASIERIDRWRRLLLYAEGFGPLRDQALAASVGNEYTVDGKLISIVEANAERFIYRRQGRNVRMPPGEIPRAIVVEIVTQWFRGAHRPANELFMGAYHACREEPNVARARAAWQRARRGGEADADQLLPLLDDPVLVAPAP